VIADGTDNPGGGGYNDTTPVLQALLDAGIENAAFGTIYDPGTVQQAIEAGVGATIEVELGGHTDESMGKPVKARAMVKMLSDGVFKNDGPMNAGVESNMGRPRCCASAASTSSPSPTASRPPTCRCSSARASIRAPRTCWW
jgi:microcystin degradation protein MlrC